MLGAHLKRSDWTDTGVKTLSEALIKLGLTIRKDERENYENTTHIIFPAASSGSKRNGSKSGSKTNGRVSVGGGATKKEVNDAVRKQQKAWIHLHQKILQYFQDRPELQNTTTGAIIGTFLKKSEWIETGSKTLSAALKKLGLTIRKDERENHEHTTHVTLPSGGLT